MQKSKETQKTASKQGSKKATPKGILHRRLAHIIDGRNSARNFPKFGRQFYAVETDLGGREILEADDNGVCCYRSDSAVTAAVAGYLDRHEIGMFAGFTEAEMRAVVKLWLALSKPIALPATVRQKSEAGLCFHRLPFDFKEGPTPVFNELMRRCTNSLALGSFIGSLFVEKADRSQFCYIHGDGMNGKGQLLKFLARCLGDAYAAKMPPTRDDKFWTVGLLGKRLVAFPDVNDPQFPGSALFKMLTGDDAIPMERKGKDAFTADINCKFLFASNDEPELTGQVADRRRAIYCEIGPIKTDPDPRYGERLWNEAPAILGKCMNLYLENTVDNGPIWVDENGFDTLVEKYSDLQQHIFHECFSRVGEDNTGRVLCECPHFSAIELAGIVRAYKLSRREKHEFIKWLRITHGIKCRSVRFPDGKIKRVYVGACVANDYAIDTEMLRNESAKIHVIKPAEKQQS